MAVVAGQNPTPISKRAAPYVAGSAGDAGRTGVGRDAADGAAVVDRFLELIVCDKRRNRRGRLASSATNAVRPELDAESAAATTCTDTGVAVWHLSGRVVCDT